MKAIKRLGRWLKTRKQPQFAGLVIFTVVFAVIGVSLLVRSFAAGEKLYITPSSVDVQPGNDVTVTLRFNAGASEINTLTATVAYDASKLQYKSNDVSGSGFGAAARAFNETTTDPSLQCPEPSQGSGSNGSIHFMQFTCGTTVTGDLEIAKITFTALGGASGTVNITVSGTALDQDSESVGLSYESGAINIVTQSESEPEPQQPSGEASFSIEPTVGAPIVGNQFGLRVYATSTEPMQGGEVNISLPSGLTYSGTLNTTGGAFNPATTVTGTNGQQVNLVFVTQSTNLTGKQLIATLPVTGSTVGLKNVTFSNGRVVDLDGDDIIPLTADSFSITINAASLPAPVLRRSGGDQLAASNDVTDLKQSFTITNYDSDATYTATLGGQSLTVSGATFTIPASLGNGDLPLLITSNKNGASGNASFTIRLRSPNIDRTGCVNLNDLLAVNGAYGSSNAQFDLNFDGTVSLVDLLTVTQNWGGACA